MTDKTAKLISLINQGKTCNEICHELNISNKQLFNYLTLLKNKGLLFLRNYCSNGVIYYTPISTRKQFDKYNNSAEDNIITRNTDKEFRCLVISDLHFGNKLERLDLLDRAYNYCIKNNIHTIFCCGDMIDGTFGKTEKYISDIYNQIEHFIKDYPFDKSILTFAVGGDHDYDGIRSGFQDIAEITSNYRHDIIIGSYNNRIINIKNDSIHLFHRLNKGSSIENSAIISLHGHPHKYTVNMATANFLHISVPSLSDINDSLPTALDLKISFNKGYIQLTTVSQIYFADKDYILNEQRYDLLKNRSVVIKPIENESGFKEDNLDSSFQEEKKKVKLLPKKDTTKLSQIEKFNKKYGDEY